MKSHTWNTRRNVFTTVVESYPSEASLDVSEVSETANLIIGLQKNTSQFGDLDKEFLNLKDLITKDLQIENHHLRKKINDPEDKTMPLEIKHNSLEQSECRSNIETKVISDSVPHPESEQSVVETLKEIDFSVSPSNMEASCHLVSSKNSLKTTFFCFVNRKYAKKLS